MSAIASLDKALKAVCPVHGVSIGRLSDKSSWRIDFTEEATNEQRKAALAVVDAFDSASVPADVAQPTVEELQEQIRALTAALLDKNVIVPSDVADQAAITTATDSPAPPL